MRTFEQLYSAYFGEVVDNQKQIVKHEFNGDELKDFVRFCIGEAIESSIEEARNTVGDEYRYDWDALERLLKQQCQNNQYPANG